MAEARAQALDYQRELAGRYGDELRLRMFAVVTLGFERVVWETVEESATDASA